MTRKEVFNLLQSFGYYRAAVTAIKHGYVVCGLSERDTAVGYILIEAKCFSSISRKGSFERFSFK